MELSQKVDSNRTDYDVKDCLEANLVAEVGKVSPVIYYALETNSTYAAFFQACFILT